MARIAVLAGSTASICIILAILVQGHEIPVTASVISSSSSRTGQPRQPNNGPNQGVAMARFPTPHAIPARNSKKPAFPGIRAQTDPEVLKPGIYKTTPFTCIVIVPESHLDDGMVVRIPYCDSNMPILKPDLHFIPIQER